MRSGFKQSLGKPNHIESIHNNPESNSSIYQFHFHSRKMTLFVDGELFSSNMNFCSNFLDEKVIDGKIL
jgi:hypothetical protein